MQSHQQAVRNGAYTYGWVALDFPNFRRCGAASSAGWTGRLSGETRGDGSASDSTHAGGFRLAPDRSGPVFLLSLHFKMVSVRHFPVSPNTLFSVKAIAVSATA